ncbi:Glycosyl hydrolase OS=Streptomyces fumanus OX=67302 GN=GCM10018772_26510 PE=3 SV=1 [Streptomyces fumanus]
MARLTVTSVLEPGQKLRVQKTVAHGWSGARSRPAMSDQVEAALAAAAHGGWEGLLAEQRSYLDDFWARADVEVDGDEEIQQAVRFGLFHVLQAGARAEQRAIPAKGLTGSGYDGHAFWDTEMFVLPVLTYTGGTRRPRAARRLHPAPALGLHPRPAPTST